MAGSPIERRGSAALGRLVDIRAGERLAVFSAMALVSLLVAGHTVLETARDTLLLMRLSPRWLNLSSLACALLAFPLAAGVARLVRRLGTRRALGVVLLVTVIATTLAALRRPSRETVMALSVFAPLAGATVIAQFWVLAGTSFSLSQSRRLFAWLAGAGVVGAVIGAGLSVLVLRVAPPRTLLALSSGLFGLAIAASMGLRAQSTPVPVPLAEMLSAGQVAQKQVLLRRLGLLMMLSTATFLVVDYLFKATAAETLNPHELGPFFARFYLVTNLLSLMVQVFVTPRVLQKLGVVGALTVTPLLFLLGGSAVAVLGTLQAVMIAKVIDGSTRHSLHRASTELLALPLPAAVRAEGKVWVDTVIPRLAQAGTALLLLLATRFTLRPSTLGIGLAALAATWLFFSWSTRGRYLEAFRRSLRDGFGDGADLGPLDLDAATVLVEGLASRDDGRVLAAIDLLVHHGHERLVSALILHHESEAVLRRALQMFGASPRSDWIPLAEGLAVRGSEAVRVAALSALVRHGVDHVLGTLESDPSPVVRAYAAYHLALRAGEPSLVREIVRTLSLPGPDGLHARRALLAAVADDPRPESANLLLRLARDGAMLRRPGSVADLVRAMQGMNDARFIPRLIELLAARTGREAVADALVRLGDPAFDALVQTLLHGTERRVRMHVPRTIGRFGTQRAADALTARLGAEPDGVVRYKILRGLGLLVGSEITFDRARLAAFCEATLREHLRLDVLRAALLPVATADAEPELPLLLELLEDKIEQALERVFRLVKLMHASHDVHRMHRAALGRDPKERASVLEYLDALLISEAERPLRPLLRLVLDDLAPAERAARAALALPMPMPTRAAALALLAADPDEAIAKLASARALGQDPAHGRARHDSAAVGSSPALARRTDAGAVPGSAQLGDTADQPADARGATAAGRAAVPGR